MHNGLIKAHLVLPTYTKRGKHYGGVAHDAYLTVQDGIITQAGSLPFETLGDTTVTDYSGHYLIPGLIDLQVNGGGGKLFNDAETLDDLRTIVQAHKEHGTTGLLATLMCDEPVHLVKQLNLIADGIETDPFLAKHILGIHLEGPFFNPLRRGMHHERLIIPPDVTWMERWIATARNQIKIVTLAPEMPGALDVVRYLTAQNIHVAMAHSEASYDEAVAAIEAGASMGTHLFNTMPPIQGRAPGLIGALLDKPDVVVGMINDGQHVHDASLRMALRAKGLANAFFVSDSMHALNTTQTIFYRGMTLAAKDGACYNDQGKFAGSAAPLLTALQRGVTHLGLSVADAVRLCTANPARLLGRTDRGQLQVGQGADFILLNADLSLVPLNHNYVF